jgi:rRNA-processing protein FCF1
MEKVLLDSSFILSCVRNRIDFFTEITLMGMQILIPEEVLKEIENIKNSRQKLKDKEAARFSSVLFKLNNFKKIKLKAKNVDRGIINFAGENSGLIIATLDREIKKKLKGKNKLMVIRGKNRLEVLG